MGTNYRSKLGMPFHNAATIIGNGIEIGVGLNNVLMNIAVTGDATGFTIVFEGKANDTDDYSAIMCCNLATLALSTTAIANGKYQMSLEGLIIVRCRLSAIASGSVSVKATIVD